MTSAAHLYVATRDARRLLVIDPGQLGDTVHLLPALWDLRAAYPEAEIHTISSPVGAEVLKMAGCMDRFWVLDQAAEKRSFSEQLRVLLSLRRLKFDLCILFGDNDRNVIHAAIVGARRRVAPKRDRWHFWSRWCIPLWAEVGGREEPAFEQRRRLLAACGVPLGPPRFDLHTPSDAKNWAEASVQTDAIHFSINASGFWKEWPLTNWNELGQRLSRSRPDLEIVATGTARPREVERLNAFKAALSGASVKTISGPSIPELAALLQRCALHIGADSGVLHLAMALGTPTLSLFREYPGNKEWLPRGPQHRHLLAACSCLDRLSPECQASQTATCLAGISAELAAKEALDILKSDR